jgi:hypothetical protein
LGYAGKELDAFPNLIDAGIYLCDGFIQPFDGGISHGRVFIRDGSPHYTEK